MFVCLPVQNVRDVLCTMMRLMGAVHHVVRILGSSMAIAMVMTVVTTSTIVTDTTTAGSVPDARRIMIPLTVHPIRCV